MAEGMPTTDRVAVVAGATGDIGAAVAEKLGGDGLTVVGWGRNQDALGRLARRGFRTDTVDIVDLDQVKQGMRSAAELGQLAVIVNAAGDSDIHSYWDVPPEESVQAVEKMMAGPNFIGGIHVALAGLEAMRKQGARSDDGRGRRIIGIGSAMASHFYPELSQVSGPYTIAKVALAGFMRTLAVNIGPHSDITVNTVEPEYIPDTQMGEHLPEDLRTLLARLTPTGKHQTAGRVAGVVSMLASPESQALTGHTIVVGLGR